MKAVYGHFYKTRSGRKVGPLRKSQYGLGYLTADGFEEDQWYSSLHSGSGLEGKCYKDKEDPLDLVEEWKDNPANRFYGEQRVEIEPGEYGRILLEGYRDNHAAIEVPYYMTADDLREAANFFNQLAEYMDSGS